MGTVFAFLFFLWLLGPKVFFGIVGVIAGLNILFKALLSEPRMGNGRGGGGSRR